MSRLLSADFAKLKKNKFFWICIIGMFFIWNIHVGNELHFRTAIRKL